MRSGKGRSRRVCCSRRLLLRAISFGDNYTPKRHRKETYECDQIYPADKTSPSNQQFPLFRYNLAYLHPWPTETRCPELSNSHARNGDLIPLARVVFFFESQAGKRFFWLCVCSGLVSIFCGKWFAFGSRSETVRRVLLLLRVSRATRSPNEETSSCPRAQDILRASRDRSLVSRRPRARRQLRRHPA